MSESNELDQEIREGLDAVVDCVVALLKITYAKGRTDERRFMLEKLARSITTAVSKTQVH